MSLQRTGVWAAGLWAPTVWAQDVWFEQPAVEVPQPQPGGELPRRRAPQRIDRIQDIEFGLLAEGEAFGRIALEAGGDAAVQAAAQGASRASVLVSMNEATAIDVGLREDEELFEIF